MPAAPFGRLELASKSLEARLMAPILHEAELMRRLRPDSLAVALRPDPETEIILRLTLRCESIEAEASYERGNPEPLVSLWPELQRRLQLEGVRLLDFERPSEMLTAEKNPSPLASQGNPCPDAGYGSLQMLPPTSTPMFSTL